MSRDSVVEAVEPSVNEPVHSPGIVQPFACLIGVDAQSGSIAYASDNCEAVVGKTASELLGADLRATLGREVVHGLRNAVAQPTFFETLIALGSFELGGATVEINAFGSGGVHVLQIEKGPSSDQGGINALSTLSYLMEQIQGCTSQTALFELTVSLLRHLTGYDRVMIYKFDQQFNGDVLAEACPNAMEPYLGLRFPKWDIPPQMRGVMAKMPLRIIQDVDQAPSTLRAADETLLPLDIVLATCRGVSIVHLQYLRNAGAKATMTLSIVIDGMLWGTIAFHHRRPRVPSLKLREVLVAFVGAFSTKLNGLQKKERLDLVTIIDKAKDDFLKDIDDDETMDEAISRIGPFVKEMVNSTGVALLTGSQTISYGDVPEQALLNRLLIEAHETPDQTLIVDNLALQFPELEAARNGCAGVLASAVNTNRALCIFRNETSRSIAWAGNPEKSAEMVSTDAPLSPRGGFSPYLQDVKGSSEPWTEQDIYFAQRMWVLVNSAERRALKNTLNRQQALMIDELNHRVRNILALVRSVSRQARRHYGSLESYSLSLESRIQALAAAHDIAASSSVSAINIKQLIAVETAPYQKEERVSIKGPERHIRAEIAPIFSLVVHELATNAAKYGSLSALNGKVTVKISDAPGGIWIKWRESGGPAIDAPEERGFGSTLIEQAVPHEMGGAAELRFAETGVEADLFLPDEFLDTTVRVRNTPPEPREPLREIVGKPFSAKDIKGVVLLLEDNFVIANDVQEQLAGFDFDAVETFANAADALEFIETETPVFAVLDINLGSGKTSEDVAMRLTKLGVPYLFVSGYGDTVNLPKELADAPLLTKPVMTIDLQNLLARMLAK